MELVFSSIEEFMGIYSSIDEYAVDKCLCGGIRELELIASKTNDAQAKTIISPLFYLNDLRVCFAHLISRSEVDKYKENIVKAFSLASFNEYRKLYDALMMALYQLYKFLYVTEF